MLTVHRRGRKCVTVALAVAGLGLSAATAHAAPDADAWPGGSDVANADSSGVFGENLSGLAFSSPTAVWAVKNGPGTLYHLVPDGSNWRPDPAEGTALHYPGGKGDPDAEGVVETPEGIFTATERDNDHGDVSKPGVLRYAEPGTAEALDATAEWELTDDLPKVDSNEGLEGIAWIPDTDLTAHGFHDEHTKAAYDPASYPGHGSGLYFVGLEADGTVYAYALDQSGGGYTRVATIPSGLPAVMDLEYEPRTGHLWAACDDTCKGHTTTLDIDADGTFTAGAEYDRPSGMPDYNNEGFAIAPQSACANGNAAVLWSDDANDDDHALRSGTLPCQG
ncbi:hypothetical protein GCM10022222_66610 [Amycolatopsis ultiminotia]|uniref:Esterase-like activity of phytase n=1 Tax=Amycolatopsis ultiminotia TaxID=543629 RepID=A0ABP6XVL9_9PSEU